jgi:hypothetical protein
MKPKAALKRSAIVGEATALATSSEQQKSQPRRGVLSSVPEPMEASRESSGAVAYASAPQSWFRKYDVSGKVIEEGLCFSRDVPLFHWTYRYSAKGQRIDAFLFNASQRLLERRVYNDKEQLTRKIIFAADGAEEQIDYEYNGEPNRNGALAVMI